MYLQKRLKEDPAFRSLLLAASLGTFLFVFFLLTAKYGVSAPDECAYYTVPHRLLLGEKLIADEWNVAQLAYLPDLLPFWAFTRVTGGTEGLVLFMRCLFIAVNTVFYVFLCRKLRRFRIWGILAAFSFSAVILQTIFSITYFTAAPMAAAAFGMLLIIDEREKGVPGLLFCGVLLACAVLEEPYLFFCFLLWAAAVSVRAVRRKKTGTVPEKYGFILRGRVFLGTAAGAAAVFAVFMTYMFLSGAFRNFAAAFPYLTSGAEIGKLDTTLLNKLREACGYFGSPFIAGLSAALIAAAALRIRKKPAPRAKRIVFLCACISLAGCCVYAGVKTFGADEITVMAAFCEYHGFPLLLFSPVLWLLCGNNAPRLTVLWLSGVLFSVSVDASSAVIIASGIGIVRMACILQLSVFLPELRTAAAEPERKKKNAPAQKKSARPFYRAALCLCCAAVIAWHGAYVLAQTIYKPYEKLLLRDPAPLDTAIEKGPLRGLVTTEHTAEVYAATLRDLDLIKNAAGGAPVTVPALAPYTYLYLDLPYGTYTAWFEYYETDRLAAFWQLRPAQQPAYIYIPYYEKGLFSRMDDRTLSIMRERIFAWVDGELTEGEAGYIIKVTAIRSPFPS